MAEQATITLPDGQKATLKGPTREAIIQKAQQLKQAFAQRGQGIPDVIVPEQAQPKVGAAEAFNRQGLERFTGSFSNLSDLILNPQMVNPIEPGTTTRSGAPIQSVRTVPVPTGEQAVAGIESGVGGVGALLSGDSPQFGERFEQSLQRGQVAEQQQPLATEGGNIAGDILTLTTGRAPFAGKIGRAERSLMATRSAEELLALPATTQREILRFVNSGPFRKVVRGTGRAAETGLEGAFLALANDGDPLTTAALAAGGQVGGSAILTAGKEALNQVPGGIGLKLVVGSFVGGGLFALLNSVPGAEDNLLEDLQTGFDKTALMLVLGGTAAAAGTGRLRERGFAESLPKVADAISNIGRGTFLSLAEEYTKAEPEDRQEMQAVVQKMAGDPGFFDENSRRRIQRVFTEKKGSLKKTIDSLKKNPDFKLRLDSLKNREEQEDQELPANLS